MEFLNSPRHICKGCPLRPCCQPGCEFLLLVWLLQSCSDLLPGLGGRTRDQLTKVTPVRDMCRHHQHRPVHPCHHQAQGSATTGLSWSWLPCLPHSDSSLAFNNTGLAMTTAQQHPAQLWHNNTTTVGEEQDWSDQIVRTAWLRWPWPGWASSDRGILDNVVMEPPWSRPGSVFTPQSRVTCQQPWKCELHRVCSPP